MAAGFFVVSRFRARERALGDEELSCRRFFTLVYVDLLAGSVIELS